MATAAPSYNPAVGGNSPPVTIDGTGLTTTIPITIKNAKSESGIELWYTGTTATGYDLMNASGTLKGGLAIAAAANDWITTSAADEVVVHVGAGKRILFGQKGAALPTLSITPSNLVTIHGAGAFLAFTGGGGGPGVGTTDGRTFALYSNNAAVAACSSDGVNFLINSGKKLLIDSNTSTTSVAVQVNGDPDTGIGQIGGANTLSVVAGGVQSMRVSANNVLIIGDLQFPASGNVVFDTVTGSKVGTATGQKIGFWGVTAVVQQVLATGAAATVDNVITFLQTIGLCKQS